MFARSKAFVGRQDILTEIRQLLAAAGAGAGQCVVIEGPAGIGKSRLLQVLARDARILGMTTATCQATELDRVAPLSTLLSALHQGGLSGIDSRTLGGQHDDRFWLVERIREIVQAHVRERPLFIAVDDAQWADEFTMMALRTLVPELAAERVFWLLALSPRAPLSPADRTFDRLTTQGAHRIRLGPLPDCAVAELCAEILGAAPDAATLTLAGRGSGNPFLLQELFTTLGDRGQLTVVEGSGTVLPGDLPPCFLDAVDLRLRDLSADARALLDAGAVLNRPFTVHEAAALLGRAAVDLMPTAKEAVLAGILTTEGPGLWFNHDLIREAVYSNLDLPSRMALHREAASMVETEGRSPAEISEHLTHCGRVTPQQDSQERYGLHRRTTPAVLLEAGPDPVRTQLMVVRADGLIPTQDSAGADRAREDGTRPADDSTMAFGQARSAAAPAYGDLDAAVGWTQAVVELTRSELPVAELVTKGLTNREVATRLFLSPHTVDSHLRHIFTKFGVNNRVELTRQFASTVDDLEPAAASMGRAPALSVGRV